MCTYMRARKYSIYIKSLEGVSERIRFQGQKSTRKGDTEMADVIICMDQLKEYYNITHAEIQINIDSKQARQRRRLEEE